MKAAQIKHDNEIPVGQRLVKADTVWDGTSLKRVTLHFERDTVEIHPGSYSDSVKMFVPEKPKMVDKWKAAGTTSKGVAMKALFDRESDARDWAEGQKLEPVMVIPVKVPAEDLEPNDGDEIPF